MTHSLRSWLRGGLVPAAAISLLVAAGCSSDRGPGRRAGGPAGMPRKPPTPMTGQDSFFDGQIVAEIKVGTDGLPEVQPGESGGERSGGGRGRRGGGGGLGLQGGAGGGSGNLSGNMPFGRGGEDGGPPREPGEGGGPRLSLMGGGRPVLIRLRFTNHGPAAVTLRIVDFVSPLGNFAVRPEQLVLEPGQSLETEPMSSQLAGSLSGVEVTLGLRRGDQAEKKIFRLHAVTAPAVNAPDAPPEK